MEKQQAQVFVDLTAHDCTCRICKAPYVGHGALCELHAAQLAEQRTQEIAKANAATRARELQARRDRRARARCELVEAV